MTNIENILQRNGRPRDLAQAVLEDYFAEKQVTYPINPFQMLTDSDVPFVFRTFSKNCEGMYIPAKSEDDIAIVGINIKRPITRQRYTAAHELCHHIKDSNNNQICNTNSNSKIEKYADSFASELLMPHSEMKKQIMKYAPNKYLKFDEVMLISEYFGVSFLACLCTLAYTYRKIDGEIKYTTLLKRAGRYQVEKNVRKKDLHI